MDTGKATLLSGNERASGYFDYARFFIARPRHVVDMADRSVCGSIATFFHADITLFCGRAVGVIKSAIYDKAFNQTVLRSREKLRNVAITGPIARKIY